MDNQEVTGAWKCAGCGQVVGDDGFSTCRCATSAIYRTVYATPQSPHPTHEHASKKRPCAWCGAHEFRAHLDGDDLCQECCHKWVRGEGGMRAEVA